MDENEKINLELSIKDLTDLVKERVSDAINNALSLNKEQIEESIGQYFKKSLFNDRQSSFESSLDWFRKSNE